MIGLCSVYLYATKPSAIDIDYGVLQKVGYRDEPDFAAEIAPTDSVTAYLLLATQCPACRIGVTKYPKLQSDVETAGAAFRVVLAGNLRQVRQFARLLPSEMIVLWDENRKFTRSVRIPGVPALLIIGRNGAVIGRWSFPGRHIGTIVKTIARAKEETLS